MKKKTNESTNYDVVFWQSNLERKHNFWWNCWKQKFLSQHIAIFCSSHDQTKTKNQNCLNPIWLNGNQHQLSLLHIWNISTLWVFYHCDLFIFVLPIHQCVLALHTFPSSVNKITGILLEWDSNPQPLHF